MNPIARSPGQIGGLIQRFRKQKGLSQTELAQLSGIRQEMISKIETGHESAKIAAICALMAALDLELTLGPRSTRSAADLADQF